MNTLPILIQHLASSATHPQAAGKIDILETHISWVILAGDYAYKLKKPVNFGFLDFSTLEKRHFYCEEELRLNRRLAPDIYLQVVPVTGTPDCPAIDGTGPAIEYAVKMRRFDQDDLLSKMLTENRLEARYIDRLAAEVARFHRNIPVADTHSPFGTPEAVLEPALENFAQIRPLLQCDEKTGRLDRLRTWTEQEFVSHRDNFAARKLGGFVRECHGDLHSNNMVLINEQVVLFDCIEFNANLRWVDVISEVAFVVMDLMERKRPDFAWRFLDDYLMLSGDYAGMTLLRFYLVYRAMVRAKVAALRAGQSGSREAWLEYADYINLAETLRNIAKPFLVIAHGLSGSGKTTLCRGIQEHLGALRLSSDVERKRLFGLAPLDKSGSGIGSGLYTREASDRTYARLEQLARTVLAATLPVIVDATFIEKKRRDAFHQLAKEMDIPYCILDFQAAPDTLRARIAQRESASFNPSEATVAVLERQLVTQEPLAVEESHDVMVIDTEQKTLDMGDIGSRLAHALSIQGEQVSVGVTATPVAPVH